MSSRKYKFKNDEAFYQHEYSPGNSSVGSRHVVSSKGSPKPAGHASSPPRPLPPFAFDLNKIQGMFPDIEREVLAVIFESHGHSVERTVDYLLNVRAEEREVDSDQSEGGRFDVVSNLPLDVFLAVCEFLDMFDIGCLSRVRNFSLPYLPPTLPSSPPSPPSLPHPALLSPSPRPPHSSIHMCRLTSPSTSILPLSICERKNLT
jgi:hypothetical protein